MAVIHYADGFYTAGGGYYAGAPGATIAYPADGSCTAGGSIKAGGNFAISEGVVGLAGIAVSSGCSAVAGRIGNCEGTVVVAPALGEMAIFARSIGVSIVAAASAAENANFAEAAATAGLDR